MSEVEAASGRSWNGEAGAFGRSAVGEVCGRSLNAAAGVSGRS